MSTTGTLYPITQSIIEGLDSVNRVGDNIQLHRLTIRLALTGGTTQSSTATCRLTVFVAQAGIIFSSTPGMGQSLTPTVNNIINRKLYEKFFQVSGVVATQLTGYWESVLEVDLPLKGVHAKYNGSATNVNTGDCLYIQLESDKTTGTTMPIVKAGLVELFFTDT